jgi:hypothetical protein
MSSFSITQKGGRYLVCCSEFLSVWTVSFFLPSHRPLRLSQHNVTPVTLSLPDMRVGVATRPLLYSLCRYKSFGRVADPFFWITTVVVVVVGSVGGGGSSG